jgi:hypothetical protein
MGDTTTQTGKLTDEVQVKNETEIDQHGGIEPVTARKGNGKERRTGGDLT